jgi:sugar lactone lactonase YvrE
MHARRIGYALLAALVLTTTALAAGNGTEPGALPGQGRALTTGLLGSVGATIGPDGALYVTEGATGEVSRIHPASGRKSTFVSGLPAHFAFVGLGGPIDIAFHGDTAYVLVSLVSDPLFGGNEIDGIYRIDDDGSYTILANLGEFTAQTPQPPGLDWFLVNGVQFSLHAVDDGFLVTDGHFNRVLHVTLDGEISILRQFDNVAPAGLVEALGTVYVAEVGPVPHTPDTGRIVSFPRAGGGADTLVASGIPMIVDVAFGPNGRLYALSQGDFGGGDPGTPASEGTGRLLQVNRDGSFTVLAGGLDRPSSLSFDGTKALVVTLAGDVIRYQIPPRPQGW